MSVNKGMSGVPTGRSDVAGCWNTGLPTGGDPYGNGAAIVLGRGESPRQGEGRQVVR
jgi:hypothetical protein